MPRNFRKEEKFEDRPNRIFQGFALPTSNTVYVPNQFFDVCLPHSSRGCVRLVSVMIRKTLGWCDAEGKPLQDQIALNYSDFEEAGISHDMIKSSVSEAIRRRFIRCVREPHSKGAGKPGVSALFELNFDEGVEYVKDPKRFRGFFAGEGNRTYVPNQYFDRVVANETLAVTKVVGSIIRFSIGFVNKWGHRRTFIPLSYSDIQRYSKIRNRMTLSSALKIALENNYLDRVAEGYFDPNGGMQSLKATYAVKWLNQAALSPIGQKNVPAENEVKYLSEKRTGIAQKNVPADLSEKRTGIQITITNNTFKQQDATAAAFEELKKEGFEDVAANAIASKFSAEQIHRQIRWISYRRVKRNRLGMLRSAIEQDWHAPRGVRSEENEMETPSVDLSGALANLERRFLGGYRKPHA